MPEKRRARRSMDRAASSSSTHRSTRHRRHSQHQQQSSPAQQTSVSYVANKVSFSLVDESNPPLMTTLVSAYNPIEDEYDVPTGRNEQHQQNLDTRESIDDDDNNPQTETKHDQNDDDDEDNDINEHDDPVLVEQLREHANIVITNILASAMSQMNSTIID